MPQSTPKFFSGLSHAWFLDFSDYQIVAPEEFLRLEQHDSGSIMSVFILPPRLGTDDFGNIEVVWRGFSAPHHGRFALGANG
jgi:hypothetical protein